MNNPVPSLNFLSPFLASDLHALNYLYVNAFLVNPHNSPCVCGQGKMKRDFDHFIGCYRCSNGCRERMSIFEETIFYNRNISLCKIIQIFHLWSAGCTNQIIEILTDLPHTTICFWLSRLRQLIRFDLDSMDEMDRRIGGEKVISQVDESKFGKHGLQRGHPVLGVWVMGGVEDGPDKRCFFEVIQDRTAATLASVLERNVERLSDVHTDEHRGYRDADFQQMELEHHTVNHSQNYVNPDSGAHTQHIESTWRELKATIPHRCYRPNLILGYLATFIWKRYFRDVIWQRLMVAACSTKLLDIEAWLVDAEDPET